MKCEKCKGAQFHSRYNSTGVRTFWVCATCGREQTDIFVEQPSKKKKRKYKDIPPEEVDILDKIIKGD